MRHEDDAAGVQTAVARDASFPGGIPLTNLPDHMREVRTTNARTGGQKGIKLDRWDLIPWRALRWVAMVFGKGARKYADRNWEKGYDWGLSYRACISHLAAFWSGEYWDNHLPGCAPDCVDHTELPHLACAAWHCLVLMEFYECHPKLDNRSTMVPVEKGHSEAH